MQLSDEVVKLIGVADGGMHVAFELVSAVGESEGDQRVVKGGTDFSIPVLGQINEAFLHCWGEDVTFLNGVRCFHAEESLKFNILHSCNAVTDVLELLAKEPEAFKLVGGDGHSTAKLFVEIGH